MIQLESRKEKSLHAFVDFKLMSVERPKKQSGLNWAKIEAIYFVIRPQLTQWENAKIDAISKICSVQKVLTSWRILVYDWLSESSSELWLLEEKKLKMILTRAYYILNLIDVKISHCANSPTG